MHIERHREMSGNAEPEREESVDWKAYAKSLLDAGDGEAILNDFEKFPPGSVDMPALAKSLLDAGYGYVIADHLEKFPLGSVDVPALAKSLLDSGNSYIIENNLDDFLDREDMDPSIFANSLMDAGKGSVIANNLEKFPPESVDAPALAKSLLDAGDGYYIVSNFEKFPLGSVDVPVLVKFFLDARKGNVIVKNLEKFPPGSIDVPELAKSLMDAGQGYAIANNLEKFPPGSVDVPALAKSLLDNEAGDFIVNNLEKFPPESVDAPALVKTLLDAGKGYLIADNFEKFPPGSVDAPALAKSLMDAGQGYAIANNLEKFPPGSVDVPALAKSLLEAGYGDAFVYNFDRFLRVDFDPTTLSPEEIEVASTYISVSEAISQQRFNLLWLLSLRQTSDLLTEEIPFTQDQLEETYRELLRDGRHKNASYLEKYAQAAGLSLPNRMKIKTVDHTKPRADVLEFIENKNEQTVIVPHKEVVQFYVDDAILHSLMKLDLVPDAASRLSFRDRMTYESLKKDCERHVKKMTRWLRWYLVRAVTSELGHQRNVSDNKLPVQLSDPDFLATRPVEDVLDFFAAASSQFRSGYWDEHFGGERWAAIADAGYALWVSDKPTREMIDHVVDLEHNTAAIFDKAPERVHQNSTALKEILDLKFSAPRAEDFLAALPEGMISGEEVIRLQEDLRAARKLETILT